MKKFLDIEIRFTKKKGNILMNRGEGKKYIIVKMAMMLNNNFNK